MLKRSLLWFFLSYSSLHSVCSLTKQRECSPVTLRQCTHACFLHLIRLVLHCASCRTQTHTIAHECSTVQKNAIITAYISPQKLLSVCAVAHVWVCDFVCEKRLGKSGLCSVDHWVKKKKKMSKRQLCIYGSTDILQLTGIQSLCGCQESPQGDRWAASPCSHASERAY